MPPRRQPRIDAVLDSVVDRSVDAIFDRLGNMVQNVMDGQRSATAALPAEERRSAYKCAGCHQMFPFHGCAMVSAKGDGFATCHRCFKFMWDAADEKMRLLRQGAKGFARASAQGAAPPPPSPRGPSPWELLGVDADASVEEIKKAYRKQAAATHPDTVPPGASDEEKEAARARFEALTRARDAMLKVRGAAT